MNTNRPTRIIRSFSIAAFTLFILLTLACTWACTGSDDARQVGLVLPLSGDAKVYGRSVERGAQLALEQLQADAVAGQAGEAGELPFELDVRDSGSHPQRAAELAAELYDAGVVAVIGGATNPEAAAMAPVAGDAKRVLLSPSASSARIAETSRYVFRLSPSDYQQAVQMGGFAFMELDLQKATLMVPRSESGQELGNVFRGEFERQGGEVMDEVSYSESDHDGETDEAVARLLKERPEAIYLAASGGDPAARRIVERLAINGYRGTIMTTSAFAAPKLLGAGGTDGLVVSSGSFDAESEDPEVRAFVEAYRAKYDEDPDTFAAQGYDAVMALAQALSGEKHRPRELWQGLRALAGYQGVTGVIQFDEQGNVSQFPRVYIVQGGKLRQVEDPARRLASLGRQLGVTTAG
jgi:branched-chain amino acid transport system substrate-binding protein